MGYGGKLLEETPKHTTFRLTPDGESMTKASLAFLFFLRLDPMVHLFQ